MNAPQRIAAFIIGLLAVFGASFGIGAAVGPITDGPGPNNPKHTQHAAEHTKQSTRSTQPASATSQGASHAGSY